MQQSLPDPNMVTVFAQFDRQQGFRASLRSGMIECGLTPKEANDLDQLRAEVQRACRDGRRIVLAIDDLDRAAEVSEVIQVTADVRDLMADGACVLVTGQPFGVTYDLHTSAGALFHEFAITEFTEANFLEMLIKYVGSVHAEPGLEETHPFTRDLALFACREMAHSKLTPRQFNFVMRELLYLAGSDGIAQIDMEFGIRHWASLAERVLKTLPALQKRHLEIILRSRAVSEDTPEAINELGQSRLAEYPEILDGVIRPLLEQNLLQVHTEQSKEWFSLSPHVAAIVRETREKGVSDVPFPHLIKLLDEYVRSKDANVTGARLSEFAALFLSQIQGFTIPSTGIHLDVDGKQLEVDVDIASPDLYVPYGTVTVCRCNCWGAPVPLSEVTELCEKPRLRTCKFGILLAPDGVAAGVRRRIAEHLRTGIVIALLTKAELDLLREQVHPESILRGAYNAAIRSAGSDT